MHPETVPVLCALPALLMGVRQATVKDVAMSKRFNEIRSLIVTSSRAIAMLAVCRSG